MEVEALTGVGKAEDLREEYGVISDIVNGRRISFRVDDVRLKQRVTEDGILSPPTNRLLSRGARLRYWAIPDEFGSCAWRAVWVMRVEALPESLPLQLALIVAEGPEEALFWTRRLGHVSFQRSASGYSHQSRFKKDFHVGLWMEIAPRPSDGSGQVRWQATEVAVDRKNYRGPALEYHRVNSGGLQLLPNAVVTHHVEGAVLFWSGLLGRIVADMGSNSLRWKDPHLPTVLKPGDCWQLLIEQDLEETKFDAIWKMRALKKKSNEGAALMEKESWESLRAKLLWVKEQEAMMETEGGGHVAVHDFDYWQQVDDFQQEMRSWSAFLVTVVPAPLEMDVEWQAVRVEPFLECSDTSSRSPSESSTEISSSAISSLIVNVAEAPPDQTQPNAMPKAMRDVETQTETVPATDLLRLVLNNECLWKSIRYRCPKIAKRMLNLCNR